MKINPNTYAMELRKRNGQDLAVRIAERCRRGTSPENWNSLPDSPIYFKKDRKGSSISAEKQMTKDHAFWVQVSNILSKESK